MLKLCAAIITLCAFAVASPARSTSDMLKGLRGVSVSVQALGDVEKAAADGLSAGELEAYILTRLREAGIPVLQRDRDTPNLSLVLAILKINTGDGYAVSTSLSLQERSTLVRDPQRTPLASTWNMMELLVRRPASMKNLREDVLRAAMDRFVKDYFAANPKP
jgi:hypothetical protein